MSDAKQVLADLKSDIEESQTLSANTKAIAEAVGKETFPLHCVAPPATINADYL